MPKKRRRRDCGLRLKAIAASAFAAAAVGCDSADSVAMRDASVADGRPPEGGSGSDDAGFDARVERLPRVVATAPLTRYVDPLVGSGGLGFGIANASVAPQRPFGFARPGPDTALEDGAPAFNHCSGYAYDDDRIWGFSQTRMHGTGIVDYGHVALMPTDGMSASKIGQRGYQVEFSHDDEEVGVGHYRVTLANGIEVELTAGRRVAYHRYTFPSTVPATVIVDPSHWIGDEEVRAAEVTIDVEAGELYGRSTLAGGYSRRFGGVTVYYVARFTQEITSHGTWQVDELRPGSFLAAGEGNGQIGAYVGLEGSRVDVRVGLSFVDVDHARANLDAETPVFDEAYEATLQEWEALLARIEATARSEDQLRRFYTALYQSLLMPTLASDASGSYRGVDGEVHQFADGDYYTDFSLWDTFRTQVPLLSLVYPELQNHLMASLVQMARDGVYMPRWPLGTGYTGGMVGESATIAFADAWRKGVRQYDLAVAYDAMRSTAMAPPVAGASYGGRRGIAEYIEHGFVPVEVGGSTASSTLEYAYNDAALAYLAEELGHTDDAMLFASRAGNWRNLWDGEFLVGRHADGRFPDGYAVNRWEDFYAEGTAWQYLWYAPA